MAGRSSEITIFRGEIMTVFLEHKVLDGDVPFNELYTDIKNVNLISHTAIST